MAENPLVASTPRSSFWRGVRFVMFLVLALANVPEFVVAANDGNAWWAIEHFVFVFFFAAFAYGEARRRGG